MQIFSFLDRLDRFVITSLAFCGFLIGFRFLYFHPADWRMIFDFPFIRSGNTLLFFVWNLYLAALPYFFIRLSEQSSNRLVVGLLLLLWLLFLPNAPYVISDLKHLRPRYNVPYWYDVVTFISCAATGLFLGGLAVLVAARKLRWQQWSTSLQICALLLFPLCGFGIYLGRVLRWNSWDLITRPVPLFSDIFHLFSHTTTLKTVGLYCAGYGFFLWIVSLGALKGFGLTPIRSDEQSDRK